MPKKSMFKKTKKSTKKTSKKVHRKRNFLKKGKSKLTTSKEKTLIMADRKFVTASATFLTEDAPNSVTTLGNNMGLIPYTQTGVYPGTGVPTTQFVFYPQYSTTNGNPLVVNFVKMLGGNSITFISQNNSAGTVSYSDQYGQAMPTGVPQYNAFYSNYLCHGSAVEVTLCNESAIAGQLVVLPVTTQTVPNALGGQYAGGYEYTGTYPYNPINWRNLLTGAVLPDDQPYSKIKFISSQGGIDRQVIRHKMLTRQLFDVDDLRDDNANKAKLASGVTPGSYNGVEPLANQWCWYIAFIPVVPTANVSTNLSIQIKIKYFLELTDRNAVTFTGINT